MLFSTSPFDWVHGLLARFWQISASPPCGSIDFPSSRNNFQELCCFHFVPACLSLYGRPSQNGTQSWLEMLRSSSSVLELHISGKFSLFAFFNFHFPCCTSWAFSGVWQISIQSLGSLVLWLVFNRAPIALIIKLNLCFYKVSLAVYLDFMLVRVCALGLPSDSLPAVAQFSPAQALTLVDVMCCDHCFLISFLMLNLIFR